MPDRLIYLTQGKVTVVDEDDYEELSKYKWHYRKGYVYRELPLDANKNRTFIYMHVQIMGKAEGVQIDHINRDKLDNRKSNLRYATHTQNQWNQGPRKGSSIYKGVCYNKRSKKWIAQIQANKIHMYIGCFNNESDAVIAYDKYAKEHFGEYAFLNGVD